MTEATRGAPRTTARRGTAAALLVLAARLGAGATFLWASTGKIADPVGFAQAVYNYRLVPDVLLHPFALLLPWLEAVIGVALLCGLARRGASLLAATLTVAFIAAISAALARGLDITCGCFEPGNGHAVGLGLLARDLALLVACVLPLRLAAYDRFQLVAAARRIKRS